MSHSILFIRWFLLSRSETTKLHRFCDTDKFYRVFTPLGLTNRLTIIYIHQHRRKVQKPLCCLNFFCFFLKLAIPSFFLRLFFSDGFSKYCFAFKVFNWPSFCTFFLSTLIACSKLPFLTCIVIDKLFTSSPVCRKWWRAQPLHLGLHYV